MRRGGRLFIILGVTLALVAVLLAVLSLNRGGAGGDTAVDEVPKVTVIQAARDIPANTVVREEDVRLVEVEANVASPGAATSPSQVVGLSTNGDVVRGQQVLMANLVTPGLSHMVTSGKRAMAIPVDRVNAVGGLIRPDDHIDLVYSTRVRLTRVVPSEPAEVTVPSEGAFNEELVVPRYGQTPEATYPYPGEPGSRFLVQDTTDGDPVTKVILQNLRVLRVIAGDLSVEADGAVRVATDPEGTTADGAAQPASERLPATDLLIVEVDAQQAEVIKFLTDNSGLVQVVLRGRDDHESIATTGITYEQLVTQYGLPVPKTVRLEGQQ